MPNSPIDYRTVFGAMPGASGLLLPDAPEFTIVASTEEFAAFAGAAMKDFIGSSLFTYFPDNPDGPVVSSDIRASLATCISTKQKNELAAQRYDLNLGDGTFTEMYWTVIHTPILDETGAISFIIHTAINVTDKVLSDKKDARINKLLPAYNLFMQSSIAIHILRGEELLVDLANEPTLQLWQKDRSVIGKPLLEILPELAGQKYIEMIRDVLRHNKPYRGYDEPIVMSHQGAYNTGYYNFALQPYLDNSAGPVGVVVMINDVTKAYNDRRALAEREKSLELAADIGELGFFSIHLGTGDFSYSAKIMEWFGLEDIHVPLPVLFKKIHPEDITLVSEALHLTADPSGKHDIVFRVLHPVTGEIQYLRSIGQPRADGRDNVMLGIIQNITDMVRTRQEIEVSEQRLRSLIESAPFPIGVYLGDEMRIAMANQSIIEVWGKGSDVIGKRYANVLPELEGSGIYEQLTAVFDSGVAFHAKNRYLDLEADGKLKPYYFNYSFTPLFDNVGEVYGVMNTAADVTDLNLAKKALEESERNFRNMILSAPVAMCILFGRDGILANINPLMEQLMGRSAAEVEGRSLFEAIPEVNTNGLRPVFDSIYQTGTSFISDEQEFLLLRNGQAETVYVRYIYEPMKDAIGTVEGIMVVASDVTPQVLARRKIEDIVATRTRELADSNLRLQSSNAELEQFAYIASHDLQEPLRKISMFTQMLEKSLGAIDDRSQMQMDRINQSVHRMSTLIRDILGYSQLARKQDPFRLTDLNKVLAEAMADFDLVLEEKGGKVTHTDLPMIEAIPLQMVQLFHNLISNSLKYSRKDVAPEINISCHRLPIEKIAEFDLKMHGPDYYALTFRDNGIGFDQEYAERIFQIFQRLHGKSEYEGTGIGLAMCRKIAENHNGLIHAVGRSGKGAEFVVVLPSEQATG